MLKRIESHVGEQSAYFFTLAQSQSQEQLYVEYMNKVHFPLHWLNHKSN